LHIKGKRLSGGTVTIDGGISSQYLTGLLLISPTLEQGLRLKIEGEVTSRPYLDMTISLLEDLGVDVITQRPMDGHGGLLITVDPGPEITKNEIQVESDWSSAGYWYSWVAFQETGYTMSLSHFKQESWQGDSALKEIYHSFGVNTIHKGSTITLEKVEKDLPDTIMLNMSNEPDQAQTLFATCLGLGVNAHLTGLHTLKIKETDRIEAMKVVGSRFRESVITTTPDSIKFQVDAQTSVTNHFEVDTFHDHRMAMAFAPLCMFTDVLIKDAGVVSKSYPNYWQHLSEAGSEIQKS
jgi:3-phosphoshikimate 1-carboxyvinyltransferase